MLADVVPIHRHATEEESTDQEKVQRAFSAPLMNRRQDNETSIGEEEFSWRSPESKPTPVRQMPIEALYGFAEDTPELPMKQALTNLKLAHKFIIEAIEADTREDAIAADYAIQQFETTLPLLFRSRSIGDGYGMIINSIMIALRNRCGMPLERLQIEAIQLCIGSLLLKPLLPDMVAVRKIQSLREAGLNPNRKELDHVADIP
jgi:hypothetical protein